jgi:N-acetylglucosamine malate deacetylase 1
MSERILVVAAHPDDEVLGVGGTIMRHVELGDCVHVIVATVVDAADYGEAQVRQRREEALEGHRLLGVTHSHFAELPTKKLDAVGHEVIINTLAPLWQSADADVVYIHHPWDVNRDHRELFDAVMVLARPKPGTRCKRLLAYETLSSTEWGGVEAQRVFQPHVFVDIAPYIERKQEIMEVYQTEIQDYPHPRSIQAIEVNAQRWGAAAGFSYAEAFTLLRERITP